jgi:REP element-mobilizing transposase RayT
MRHRIFLHIVWTTRDRAPSISAPGARFLVEFIPRIAAEENAHVYRVGIVSTHVHVLVRTRPVTLLPRLVQRWKGASATLGRRANVLDVRWADGYSVQSVGQRALHEVARYVSTQHLHHPLEAIPGWPLPPQAEES